MGGTYQFRSPSQRINVLFGTQWSEVVLHVLGVRLVRVLVGIGMEEKALTTGKTFPPPPPPRVVTLCSRRVVLLSWIIHTMRSIVSSEIMATRCGLLLWMVSFISFLACASVWFLCCNIQNMSRRSVIHPFSQPESKLFNVLVLPAASYLNALDILLVERHAVDWRWRD
jgi:hypothetical protein